jgi:outer membrane protein
VTRLPDRGSKRRNGSRLALASGFALGICCAFPLQVNAQSVPPLSMAEAIQLALAHNRSIHMAAIDVKRADEQIKAASTRRLPNFAVFAQGGETLLQPYLEIQAGALGLANGTAIPAQNAKISSSGQAPSAFAFVQVLEPLTQQYQLSLQMKELKVGREISNQHLRTSEQEVVQRVRQLYCQIVEDQSAEKSAQANMDLYAEVERVTKIYVAEKTAQTSDLLDVQARLLHARYEWTSASNTRATHEEELNDLLGRPVESELTLDPDITIDFVLPTPAEAMQRALAARPDLHAANLQAKQADLSRREKKAEYIPNVSLEGSYAAIHDSSLPIGGTSYAEVGVQLKWEPFDWGRKYHELTEKSEIVEQSRLNITELEAKAHIEVNTALRNAEAASELLRAETFSVEAVDRSIKVAQQKYAEHAVLLNEVLKIESERESAQHDLVHARSNVQSAYASLLKAMGEDN